MPKGVPLEPGQQHLAVHVEDHPLEYATFEGEIPKGQYGAGTVEIWDKGTYELVEEKKDGGLTVRLHGERLKGTYALVPAKLSGDPKNWLILRKKDESAPGRTKPRKYRPMLATLAERRCRAADWLYEIKWDGYRIVATVAGGEADAPHAQGPGLHQALRERREGAREGASKTRTASSTARSARSTRTGGRASRRCSRASPGRRSSTTSSTCSRSRASR